MIIGKRYHVLDELGSGGFGTTYKCKDRNGSEIAVKVHTGEYVQLLRHEARIHCQLSSKGCVPRMIAWGTDEDSGHIAMELCTRSLDSLAKGIPMTRVLDYGSQLVSALETIHGLGFVHRDIKPENLFERSKGRVIIGDLGLATSFVDGEGHRDRRKVDCIIGTSRYASLDVCLGYEPFRKDDVEGLIFSLVYLECGCLPWQGKEAEAVINMKMNVQECIRTMCGEFVVALGYLRSLKYDCRPDYAYLAALLTNRRDLEVRGKTKGI